jgi:iron complex outermembrane receptor protein
MMRYIITAITLFTCSALHCAEFKGVIYGKIIDRNTLAPLEGVYITYGRHLGTTSDNNGFYLISTESEKLTITFQFLGYSSIEKELTIIPNDTVNLNIEMEMKIREIDQIVVSAGKTEQKVAELSVSMDVVRTLFLSSNHITDAQEILNKTPGIEVMDGQASVRGGSGFSYGAGSRVLALIDGLPVLSADAGNIKWQFLPLENISQVEIIKGASSVLYGSSALNGIINFRQADATNIPETHFYTEAGIYNKPSNKDWKWWDTPRILTGGSVSHLQKYGKNSIGLSTAFLYDNGYRKLNYEKLGRIGLRLKHYVQKIPGLTYGINLNAGYNDKQDFVLWEDAQYGALKQSESTAVELHGNIITVDPYISFSKTNCFRHDLKIRIQSTRNKFPNSEQNNSDATSLYAEYQAWYKVGKRLNLTAGILENNGKITSNFYGDHTSLNLAGYTQVEYRLASRLKTIAGIRIEQYSLDHIHDKAVPVFRTGINFQAADFTFLRFSFGQGYRYPSIAEKFASTTLGSVKIFPNPEVQSEKGWNSELGIKQGIKLGKINGQADLSAFLTRNNRLIEYVFSIYPDPVTGVPDFGFKATNVEQSRIIGYEIEFSLNTTTGPVNTSINGGYTYISPLEYNKNTRQTTGVYLKYRRKHSVNMSVSSSWKRLELGFSLYAKSRVLNIDDVFLNIMTREMILPGFYDYWLSHNKGYVVFDGFTGYKITDHLSLSFMVKNATNKEYMGRPGDIQPQRLFSLRLSGNY